MKKAFPAAVAFAMMLASGLSAAEAVTFRNPVNPSADPWMGHYEGEYHLATTQGDCVRLWSAKSITGLRTAKPVKVWQRGEGVWAAEFHRLKGTEGMRWYCCFTKTDGPDVRHRMFVMESKGDSIKGPYGDPGSC